MFQAEIQKETKIVEVIDDEAMLGERHLIMPTKWIGYYHLITETSTKLLVEHQLQTLTELQTNFGVKVAKVVDNAFNPPTVYKRSTRARKTKTNNKVPRSI